MAFTYGFYNSVSGDRKYNAEQFGSIFDGLITEGVYEKYGNQLKVSAISGSTGEWKVLVNTGRAWLKHTWALVDSPVTVTFPSNCEPEVLNDKYVSIVLEVNKTERLSKITCLCGATDGSKKKATLSRTDTKYQALLAYVLVRSINHGGNSIISSDITNAHGKSYSGAIQYINLASMVYDPNYDINPIIQDWDNEFQQHVNSWQNTFNNEIDSWENQFNNFLTSTLAYEWDVYLHGINGAGGKDQDWTTYKNWKDYDWGNFKSARNTEWNEFFNPAQSNWNTFYTNATSEYASFKSQYQSFTNEFTTFMTNSRSEYNTFKTEYQSFYNNAVNEFNTFMTESDQAFDSFLEYEHEIADQQIEEFRQDGTDAINEFRGSTEEFLEGEREVWHEWFTHIQGQLSEDAATRLQKQIDSLAFAQVLKRRAVLGITAYSYKNMVVFGAWASKTGETVIVGAPTQMNVYISGLRAIISTIVATVSEKKVLFDTDWATFDGETVFVEAPVA